MALPRANPTQCGDPLIDYSDLSGFSGQANCRGLSDDAVKLKSRALRWVYLTEWLVTTGTLLASGYVAYSLLVRRRLYREIGTTRLRSG
jgi:hypothetical protein